MQFYCTYIKKFVAFHFLVYVQYFLSIKTKFDIFICHSGKFSFYYIIIGIQYTDISKLPIITIFLHKYEMFYIYKKCICVRKQVNQIYIFPPK